MSKEIIINSRNAHLFVEDKIIDGERKARGLMPRSFATHPVGYGAYAPAFDIPLIPESEWQDRLDEQVKNKAQLSDIRNTGMGGKPIPSRDQNGKGYCFPAGTRVRMADGSQKKIEDMKLLDEVLTAEGNVGRVMQCHVREHKGELVKIKAWGHGHLRLTPNHSVLTRRGYVPAGELVPDDLIAVPKYAPQASAIVLTAEHVRAARRILVGGGEVNPGVYNPVPDVISLTPGAGRIFGLWLAEGHADGTTNSVVWSFDVEETETLAAGLVQLLSDEWGLTATTRPGPGPNVTQVVIRGKLWCQLFKSLCGQLAGGKRIHADLMGGPREFLEALFWGWMDGDGCRRGRRGKAYHCGATISHDLALNMYDVANFLGLTPAITREQPQQNRYAKTRRPVWKVQVNPNPSDFRPNYRMYVEERYVWRTVRFVEREPFVGTVFNIGVEGDNSYVAEGVGVHNCWAHSSTSAALIIRALNNEPYADLSAYAVACVIKNFRDQGGWGAESLAFIAERGIPTSEFWPQKSMSRSNDNPKTWENAAKHKFTEWMDLDPSDMKRQLVTCLLLGIPVVSDFNWWGHSVCSIDLVSLNPFRTRIWNSWGDSWSANGTGILEARRAIPDAAIAPRVMTASAA
jgi:hypothetical protein